MKKTILLLAALLSAASLFAQTARNGSSSPLRLPPPSLSIGETSFTLPTGQLTLAGWDVTLSPVRIEYSATAKDALPEAVPGSLPHSFLRTAGLPELLPCGPLRPGGVTDAIRRILFPAGITARSPEPHQAYSASIPTENSIPGKTIPPHTPRILSLTRITQ